MAQPITAIPKPLFSEEKKAEQKMNSITTLVTENKEAIEQMMTLVNELHEAGLLEAATAVVQAKDKMAEIGLKQLNREPVTNLLSLLMGATGALTNFNAEQTTKLVGAIATGLTEANDFTGTNQKVKVLDLIKLLNDPDINRAIGFLIHFLKGMGSGLKDKNNKMT